MKQQQQFDAEMKTAAIFVFLAFANVYCCKQFMLMPTIVDYVTLVTTVVKTKNIFQQLERAPSVSATSTA